MEFEKTIDPELIKFAENFADHQIGLDLCKINVLYHTAYGFMIILRAQSAITVDENRDMANELISLLFQNGFGEWQLYSVYDKGFRIEQPDRE